MPVRWNSAADIRRRQIESGNDLTFSRVFVPYYTNLITSLRPGSLLEVGCGTGHLSAALANSVPSVTALEPSPNMYAVAQDVLRDKNVELLNFSIQDYSSNEQFDIIISHMCIQVIDDLDDFTRSIVKYMHQRSLFVFSLPHPCFYNTYKAFFAPEEFDYMCESQKLISFTITKEPNTPISGVPYNHRPLSRYFSCINHHDMCVSIFDEIFPEPEIQALYGIAWDSPRYCVFYTKKQ